MQIIFLYGTKCLWLPQYVNKFLVWHKKFGPAQTILGPVKGQGTILWHVYSQDHVKIVKRTTTLLWWAPNWLFEWINLTNDKKCHAEEKKMYKLSHININACLLTKLSDAVYQFRKMYNPNTAQNRTTQNIDNVMSTNETYLLLQLLFSRSR